MMTVDTDRQAEKAVSTPEGRARNAREHGSAVSNITADQELSGTEEVRDQLMELVVSRENMMAAYRRVLANKGAAGVDDMPVKALLAYLRDHWAGIKEDLLKGRYQPSPVLKVEIPKPGGGVRQLGIPTVLDRLIQQALHQVLMPIFDPHFSNASYGFRPARSAHQAVLAAKAHVASGRRWVVDMDLEKFFDCVNHDMLMVRVGRKVGDKRVLALIGRYLRAGLMADGIATQRRQGTPQGGPLSPLLSNILLDDLDRELERRGHAFCRYADDCNIYVHSRRAGERVLASLTRFLNQRLKLKVNSAKSAVDRPWNRSFLGYSMTHHRQPRLKVSAQSVKRFKGNLKALFRRGRGQSLSQTIAQAMLVLRGWIHYFRLAETKGVFDALDGWLRRKLRAIVWRQWKHPSTRKRNLMQRGIDEYRAWKAAGNGRGPWCNAGASHMNQACPTSLFRQLGLTPLIEQLNRLRYTS